MNQKKYSKKFEAIHTGVNRKLMQFCKDCGTVLNLFGNNDRELCSSCIQHKKLSKPLPPAINPEKKRCADHDILSGTLLCHEEDKIIIRSKEGWELWSGPSGSTTDLQTLLSRAKRIYEIRLRRQKN